LRIKKARQELLKRFNTIRRDARSFLINNAKASKSLFPPIIQGIIEGKDDLDAYLNIG
jgi:hypothetical protein